jgi:hypothetical protein
VGASLYVGECRSCHLRLTHVPGLVAADGGRAYLVDFLLFGFDGEAEIDGSLERFDHPPFAELSDEEVAAVLNHLLVSWGNEDDLPDDVEPYRPGGGRRGARSRPDPGRGGRAPSERVSIGARPPSPPPREATTPAPVLTPRRRRSAPSAAAAPRRWCRRVG